MATTLGTTLDKTMAHVEQTLLRLELTLLDPDVRSTRTAVAAMLDDEFCEFGASGVVFNKQQILDALASEPPREFVLNNFHIVALRGDIAVVSYRATRYDLLAREKSDSLRSSTWIRHGDDWKLLFHHGTAVE